MFEYNQVRYLGAVLVLKRDREDRRAIFLTRDQAASLVRMQTAVEEFVDTCRNFCEQHKKMDLPLSGGGSFLLSGEQLELVLAEMTEIKKHAAS